MGYEDLWIVEKNARSTSHDELQKWNPPYSGEIDVYIDHEGNWFHEGAAFKRKSLVEMFSKILRREGDGYYLVTPVEKWKIRVADVPFIVIDYRLAGDVIVFLTSLGDQISLVESNPIIIRSDVNHNAKPYIHVRDGLYAILSRNVYYSLTDKMHMKDAKYGIYSGGIFFRLE